MNIMRVGKINGRFPSYRLLIDGVDVGAVRRKMVKGKDGNASRKQPAYDVWAIAGTECSSKERAEFLLIERAKRFGLI